MSRRWAVAGFVAGGIVLAGMAAVSIGLFARRAYPPIKEVSLRVNEARIGMTKNTMNYVGQMIEIFKLDHGRYPEKLEDLVRAPTYLDLRTRYPAEGYIKEIPTDGWDRKLIYRRGVGTGKPYELISYGADGREGGEGVDADIVE